MRTSSCHRRNALGTPGTPRWALLGVVLPGVLGLLLSTGACDKNGSLLDEPGGTALPGVKINLPAPPSFAEPNIPKEYPDGSVSVYGLRKEFHRYSEQKNKYLGTKVKLKAFLLDVYKCPVCPKNQTCKPCEEPHMFVVDEQNQAKEKAMVVAEYRAFKQREPKITIGKQYVFEGTFQQSSPHGFSASDGLLVFNKFVDDSNKEYIGPAEELEKQQAKAEAEAQKLLAGKQAQATGAAPKPAPPK